MASGKNPDTHLSSGRKPAAFHKASTPGTALDISLTTKEQRTQLEASPPDMVHKKLIADAMGSHQMCRGPCRSTQVRWGWDRAAQWGLQGTTGEEPQQGGPLTLCAQLVCLQAWSVPARGQQKSEPCSVMMVATTSQCYTWHNTRIERTHERRYTCQEA